MTKAHKDFQGLTRGQMRDISHALAAGKTKRQLAIKYGVTENTVIAAKREVAKMLRKLPHLASATA